MAVDTIKETNEQIEEVVCEQVVEATEEQHFEHTVTIYGSMDQYSWESGDPSTMAVTFCTFNTTIGEDVYSVNVGIMADKTPVAVINYNAQISVEVMNFIVNHIMKVTIEQSEANDDIFFNREEGVDVEDYHVISPVLTMVGVLHSWANLARFEANQQETVEADVQEEQADVE